jgi:hypothetical protein
MDAGDAGNMRLRWVRRATVALLIAALVTIIGAVQAAAFYGRFAPGVERANGLLFDLMVERAQGGLYAEVQTQLQGLKGLAAHGEDSALRLAQAWDAFDDHFAAAPVEALEILKNELPALGAGLKDAADELEGLRAHLERLIEIYSDPYDELIAELDDPPVYLRPTAAIIAETSGYRQAVTLNRALYLAQVGEIGTSRVMLTGLHAQASEARTRGLVNYMLGRLQFELFRSRPEAEFYTQSVMYLRESLKDDPEASLTQRLFDYLLSLSQTEAVPREGEGRPTTPAEGEGAAISADRRRF